MEATDWILPELAWTPAGVVPELALRLQGGRIAALEHASRVPKDARALRLPGKLLLPGFVNAHSHAFQRSFRAQTEFLRLGREEEDFWSWRQQMYGRALALTPEEVYRSALRLYQEQRLAGYTTVGEFHYIHHREDGGLHQPSTLLADTIIQAALDAGVRISLLMVLYHTGGIQLPAQPEQRRFTWPTLDSYLEAVEALLALWGSHARVNIGLAPHSIRAVPVPWLRRLADWNEHHRLPVHMHVCEQLAEVEASRELLGNAPLAVIQETGLLNERFVGVHATHLEPYDPQRLADAGARVCACPSTEANLGDGFLPALALTQAGVPICIGSDSHIVVDPLEELRMIENNERLQRRRRNVLAPTLHRPAALGLLPSACEPFALDPDLLRTAPGLLEMGARQGALALGLDAGELRPGQLADFTAVDLSDPALCDVPPAFLPEALVYSASPRCLRPVNLSDEE